MVPREIALFAACQPIPVLGGATFESGPVYCLPGLVADKPTDERQHGDAAVGIPSCPEKLDPFSGNRIVDHIALASHNVTFYRLTGPLYRPTRLESVTGTVTSRGPLRRVPH